MNWDLRASPPWELTELDRNDFNDLTDAHTIKGDQNKGVFSFELGYDIIGDETVKKQYEQKHSTMASSPSGSSKRQRGHSSDGHVSCVVDGCISDLSSCRDYYRRHRVCEVHSKRPVVTICGKEQRFCQQCSRFHPLGEFDEVKRSCRKRLDGHNRRRRKPRAESMCLNFGSFLTNHRDTGSKMLQFGRSSAFMTTFGSPLIEPNEEKYHQQLVTVQKSTSSNPFFEVYSEKEIKFPFRLTSDTDKVNKAVPEVSNSQPVLNTNASAEKLTQLVESKGALSLLSKHSTHTSGTSLGNLMQSGPLPQHLHHSQLQLDSQLQFGLKDYLKMENHNCSHFPGTTNDLQFPAPSHSRSHSHSHRHH